MGTLLVSLAPACTTTRSFVVDHAMLADATGFETSSPTRADGRRGAQAFLDHGHALAAGHGTVIIYRQWSPGSLVSIDDETFEYITISVDESLAARAGELPIDARRAVAVVYARGATAWPRAACFGIADAGMLRHRPAGDGRVAVDVSFEVPLSAVDGGTCARGHIRKQFVARPAPRAALP